ncbi:membrane or secreted protein [Roseiconus nitratireducens]|uniref:Membrane or secreted protein n=1 Tax=Roseiconus nitratireducens TaxID=2605748 RepID=A0A5M6DA67_9BACT|nr:membrane or secreted protein [Roseiconus nitratireducens]KAA5543182.1 membrane or secreted protein [Roseiconus nitratireducens]
MKIKQSTVVGTLGLAILAGSGGCQALVQSGCIAPPGPMNYQQANAVVHDPFPQADLGPDDHTMRPPDYQNPLPLPVRNQMKTQVAPWLAP